MRDHPLQNLEGAGQRAAGGFGGGVAQLRIDTRDEKDGLDGEGSEWEDGGIETKLKAVSCPLVYAWRS